MKPGVLIIAAVAVVLRAAPAPAELLSEADQKIYRQAFAAAEKDHWRQARSLARRGGDPLPRKILEWMYVADSDSHASFEAITGFIQENPDWPQQAVLARRADEALTDRTPHQVILAWYADRIPPQTTNARTFYGRALIHAGRNEEANAALRKVWVEGSFGSRQQKDFLRYYGRRLRTEDHIARLERLLWNGTRMQAIRMLKLVPQPEKALATARIRLHANRGRITQGLAAVPAELKDHPGLVYERVRWRRRHGLATAIDLLEQVTDDPIRPDRWAVERILLAERLVEKGEPSRAYDLVRRHKAADPVTFARAEFLAGWIALRHQEDPETALRHFAKLDASVTTPISKARAAYWAGRAAEATGDSASARKWFTEAAKQHGTYYGQLAKSRISVSPGVDFDDVVAWSSEEMARFESDEMVRAARVLAFLGRARRMDPFLWHVAARPDHPFSFDFATREALALGRRDLAVKLSLTAHQEEGRLLRAGFPVIDVEGTEDTAEKALILSLVRQESNFNLRAVSASGARGLMQLVPSTARGVARAERLRYSRKRLTRDESYNLRLGLAYVSRLIDRFDGSYALAIAAYNAGPAKVKRWLSKLGDPREPDVDMIDWIESIPYEETRNHLQRVLENLQVYRTILGTGGMEASLGGDLIR